jgi:PAS domain S-box-containing protein
MFDGKPSLIGVGIDITERKLAEQALRESQKQLSLIYETVSDVLFLLTVEPGDIYRFASVNPVFLAATGLKLHQVVGKQMEDVLPEAAHALVRDKYRQAILTNKAVTWEEMSVYPTGTLYGRVTVTPAVDANGVCTHLIGSVNDITQIRRAEEEIRKLNQELEQRVVERTAQLQVANKELESFSYSVSHDLRAPLRAISGFAEIIARRHRASLNAEGQHYFDNIVQASDRMGHLIDDLLKYSRLGRQALRLQPVALSSLLAGLANDLAPQLAQVGGTLEIAADLPTVTADKTLLSQIFTNLLENALTYRQASVPLRLAVTWQAEDGAVVVRVRDNGIGIPVEHHQRIFNVFQRLHSEEQYPGTGIGLATVRKSAEMLGGSVWVESEAGSGSTFCVRLQKE